MTATATLPELKGQALRDAQRAEWAMRDDLKPTGHRSGPQARAETRALLEAAGLHIDEFERSYRAKGNVPPARSH